MIKANELRIGNYVNLYVPNGKGQAITGYNPVTQIGSEYIWLGDGFRCKPEDLNPIPLTEEILLKFGFERMYDSYYSFEGFSIELDEFYTHIYVDWCENNYKDSVRCWEGYGEIHQLQNLYFALTGKELEVSL